MDHKYLNIYNNLIRLTRNKSLYLNISGEESFSDRIIFLLLHLSFFLKIYKRPGNKDLMQDIHDFVFRQIELSIREIGYGDVSINKNMKKYVNFFYDILSQIDNWDNFENTEKEKILNSYINKPKKLSFYSDYFDKLVIFYKNNTLNYFTKDIEELKI